MQAATASILLLFSRSARFACGASSALGHIRVERTESVRSTTDHVSSAADAASSHAQLHRPAVAMDVYNNLQQAAKNRRTAGALG